MSKKKFAEPIKAEQLAQAMELVTALMYGHLVKALMPKVDVVLLERKKEKE